MATIVDDSWAATRESIDVCGFAVVNSFYSSRSLERIGAACLELATEAHLADQDPERTEAGYTSQRWDILPLLETRFRPLNTNGRLLRHMEALHGDRISCGEAMMHRFPARVESRIDWHTERRVCLDSCRIALTVVLYPFGVGGDSCGALELIPRRHPRADRKPLASRVRLVPVCGMLVLLTADVHHRVPAANPNVDRYSLVLRFYSNRTTE
ncbi:MAG: hypothetical protein IPJ24_04025 [bacterium]|nr:hypothetical protein [bacterium]